MAYRMRNHYCMLCSAAVKKEKRAVYFKTDCVVNYRLTASSPYFYLRIPQTSFL